MKNAIWIVTFLSFLIFQPLGAQVSEQIKGMSQGQRNALLLEIPDADKKLVTDVWTTYMKEMYNVKPKWDRKAKEWVAEGVFLSNIGTVNLYSNVEDRGNGATLFVWIDRGEQYLSFREDPVKYDAAESFLYRVSIEVKKEKVRQELAEQEKALKKLESDLTQLQNANERYHKEIEAAKERIKKAEQNIVQNEKEQESAMQQIEQQKQVVAEVQKRLSEIN